MWGSENELEKIILVVDPSFDCDKKIKVNDRFTYQIAAGLFDLLMFISLVQDAPSM